MTQVSVVVPIFNEFENVDLMYQQLVMAMKNQNRPYEILFIDDGSTDGTRECLQEIAEVDHRVKLVILSRNYGQTAAMMAGIDHARGDLIVTIDGDLQNDPDDIPMMLDTLEKGYDLVHGWRKNRQEKFLSRRLPSLVANWIISKATRFPIHDLGCTLKAMRSNIAKQLELYGEMHRFIPILANQLGARCVEVETRHRARAFGQSKYGIDRTSRVILDLITVKFLTDFRSSPMKMLGKVGIYSGFLASVSMFVAGVLKMFFSVALLSNPLVTLAILATAISVQMFGLGLIAEMCTRIYFSSEVNQTYQVSARVNFDSQEAENPPVKFPRIAA